MAEALPRPGTGSPPSPGTIRTTNGPRAERPICHLHFWILKRLPAILQSLGTHYSCRCSIVLVLLTQNTQSTPKYPHKRTFQRKKTFLRSGQDCNCKTSMDISITAIVDYFSILSCFWEYFWYISDVSHRITTSMILFNELFLNVEAWTQANKIEIFSYSVVSSTWKKYSKRSHNFYWYLCLLVPTCAYLLKP